MNEITENPVYRFTKLLSAEAFRDRASKPLRIVLGDHDDGTPYWVCSPADAERLVRAGYEYAE